MNQKTRKHMVYLDMLANGDDKYYWMGKRLRRMEESYELVLELLPEQSRDTVCEYIWLCEEMSRRKLEIACTYMEFPKILGPE